MASIADMLDIRRQKAWDDYHAEMFAESTYTQQARQAADALRLAQIKKDQADEMLDKHHARLAALAKAYKDAESNWQYAKANQGRPGPR